MELLKCPECGYRLSGEPRACHRCGMRLQSARVSYRLVIGIIVVLALAAFWAAAIYVAESREREREKQFDEEQAEVRRKRAEAKLKREKNRKRIEKHFSKTDGTHVNLVKRTKQMMVNPGSFHHGTTVWTDEGDYLFIRMSFMEKNESGAVVSSSVSARVDLDGNVLKIVRKE